MEKLEVRIKIKILSMLFCLEELQLKEEFYYLQLFTAYKWEIHTHVAKYTPNTYTHLCLLMHPYAQKCSIEVRC